MGIKFLNDLLNIKFNKNHYSNLLLYALIITSLFSPGILLIFTYSRKLYLELNILKLLILSISFSLPLFLFSIFIYYKTVYKRHEKIVNSKKQNLENYIQYIIENKINEKNLKKEEEKNEKEWIRGLKNSAFEQIDEVKEKMWMNILYSGSILNLIIFYIAFIWKLGNSLNLFISNLIHIEIIVLGSFVAEVTDEVKENRFSRGKHYPHCDHDEVSRDGKFNGKQRYICKSCRRIFNDFTHSKAIYV